MSEQPDAKLVKLWGALPTSLANNRKRGQIRTPMGIATPFYCANCHKWAGYVFGDVTHMLYLCDDCDTFGTGLELAIVDEDTVRTLERGNGCSTTT